MTWKNGLVSWVLIGLAMGLSACLFEAAEDDPSWQQAYQPLPWGLIHIWWDIGEDIVFESLSMDVTFHDDVSKEVKLFFAPIAGVNLSGTSLYGGLQTQVDGRRQGDRRLKRLGPGFLFSRWGERSLEAIRPSVGGYYQSSGCEGDYISVRRPYAWKKGTYTFQLIRMDTQTIGCRRHTWVGAYVYSHQDKENVFVGLRFQGNQLVLKRELHSFVEVYGGREPLKTLPRMSVTFGNLRVNGRPVKNLTAFAQYPHGVPDYTQARASGKAVVVEIGRPTPDRQQRRVWLIAP